MIGQATRSEPGARRWRDTLQARLIASHVLVILVALGLVLFFSGAYLRRHEHTVARQRLVQIAVPLVVEANVAGLGSAGQDLSITRRIAAIDAQAAALGIRILIVDAAGVVRYDNAERDSLFGETVATLASDASSVIAGAQRDTRLHYRFVRPRRGEPFAGNRVLVAAARTGPLEARNALVLITDRRPYPLLGFFLPRLFLVTGISLLIASLAGYALSRRIASPVRRLTAAAQQMARGQLDQQVEHAGDDEIGDLVASFNAMSKQIAATYRSQRDLLGNVAHELRTPLTSVQGYAQALRDGVIERDDERTHALEVIGQESERMANLIDQLLDLSRLESGQARLTITAVPATMLMERVLARFHRVAADKQVALTASAPEHLIVLGDEGRLLQILSNLVANAIRHTPAGGMVAVSAASAANLPTGKPGIRFTVHDTGEGIPAERLHRIFDRFERGEAGTGFGLGLTIARELVELHGGRIEAHSRLGQGTTFTVDLPASADRSAQPNRLASAGAGSD